MENNIIEELNDILSGMHPDVDFMNEDELIDRKILDSFDIVQLVSDISDTYDIDINPEDMKKENFNSLKAMESLILSKLDE